jgi:hypothetical protein
LSNRKGPPTPDPSRRPIATILPVVAIVVLVAVVGGVIWAAVSSGTLGFDFLAYHQAAERVLAGKPLYDPTIETAGGFGLFYYPPPFAVVLLPFGLLPGSVATWLWLGLSVAMLLGTIWLMPVRPTVRWATLLLAGLSWPVAYALKLGQVGPLLLLLFVIGWRWRDRPMPLAITGALGAIIKIQPGIILAWAFVTGRWRAVAFGATIILASAIAATLVVGGPSIWPDYLVLLRHVSSPITTPHNFTPGAVAFQMGMTESAATAIQVGTSILVVAAALFAALRLPSDASYVVAVIASQLLSPVLWDHYAMLLLLPVAFLLERGHWWAVVIPLATSVLVLPFGLPPVLYPLAFVVALIGVLVVGRHPAPAEASATGLDLAGVSRASRAPVPSA